MATTTITHLPEIIYVIFRGPSWAGLGHDRLVDAGLVPPGRALRSDWDGVMASTQWSERHGAVRPSERIRTVARQGADFGLSDSGEIGAWWPDGTPHMAAFDWGGSYPRWTWTHEEYDYLRALLMLRGEQVDDA